MWPDSAPRRARIWKREAPSTCSDLQITSRNAKIADLVEVGGDHGGVVRTLRAVQLQQQAAVHGCVYQVRPPHLTRDLGVELSWSRFKLCVVRWLPVCCSSRPPSAIASTRCARRTCRDTITAVLLKLTAGEITTSAVVATTVIPTCKGSTRPLDLQQVYQHAAPR